MVDYTAIQLALRARALTLVVCTTGSTSLGASAAGYTRAAGSFLADGFRIGMEATPAGFVQTSAGVITDVSASLLTIAGGLSVESASAGRTLTVGLPATRIWDNEPSKPIPGRPYLEEDFAPASGQNLGLTSGGTLEDVGLYVLRWYGLQGVGIADLRDCTKRLAQHFAPGNAFAMSDGNTVRIRGDIKPTPGQILPAGEGWSVVRVVIPWRLFTLNVLT